MSSPRDVVVTKVHSDKKGPAEKGRSFSVAKDR